MNEYQAQTLKGIAEEAFPNESGEVSLESGSTAYVVTLEEGKAVEVAPA